MPTLLESLDALPGVVIQLAEGPCALCEGSGERTHYDDKVGPCAFCPNSSGFRDLPGGTKMRCGPCDGTGESATYESREGPCGCDGGIARPEPDHPIVVAAVLNNVMLEIYNCRSVEDFGSMNIAIDWGYRYAAARLATELQLLQDDPEARDQLQAKLERVVGSAEPDGPQLTGGGALTEDDLRELGIEE